MKKLVGLALASVLITALTTGCTQSPAEPASAQESAVMADGTYLATGTADKDGWIPEISITINSGKVTAVKYDEVAALTKSENIEYQKSFKAQMNIDLISAYSTMQNSLIKNQDIAKVDYVAGATIASDNFKALTEEALKNAVADGKYKDGEYTAQGAKDEKNWTPTISITIKGGKITAVEYDEVSSKIFKNKSKDISYLLKFKEIAKQDLIAIYETLQNSLLEVQDPAKIDVVSGATSTHKNFTELAAKALEKAK